MIARLQELPFAVMIASLRPVVGLFREAASRWVDDHCTRLGAALSYYAIFSLFPLALLSVTALGFVLGNGSDVREQIVGYFNTTGPPEARGLLDQTLASMQEHRSARGIGAIVGIATLLLGASGVFSELDDALNMIWRVAPGPSVGVWRSVLGFARGKAIAFALVLSAAVVLLASLVISTALSAVSPYTRGLRFLSGVWTGLELVVSGAFLAAVSPQSFACCRAPASFGGT